MSVDPFALFCAYHLGFDVNAPARPKHYNGNDVARLLSLPVDALEDALRNHKMHSARMLNLDFDVAAARFDLEASPAGVDLVSIAAMHWDLFRNAKDKPRDWQRELDDDAAENAKTFRK